MLVADVVLDRCPQHGLWFDRGELTAVFGDSPGAPDEIQPGLRRRLAEAATRAEPPIEPAELAELGYHERWLSAGVLLPVTLRRQLRDYRSPDADPNREHYRHAAFQAHLQGRRSIDDAHLDALLELDRIESATPGGLVDVIAYALLRWDWLTDAQFERVVQSHADDPAFQHAVRKARGARAVR